MYVQWFRTHKMQLQMVPYTTNEKKIKKYVRTVVPHSVRKCEPVIFPSFDAPQGMTLEIAAVGARNGYLLGNHSGYRSWQCTIKL